MIDLQKNQRISGIASLNKRLIRLLSDWQANGSEQQEGFNWDSNRHNWLNTFPRDIEFLSKLPEDIDRQIVRRICDSGKYSVRQKFLAVMVWGYGDRGYGPYRVNKMLQQDNAEKILSKVFEICRSGKPTEAYEYLRVNRVHILGPSYSSKFISFCTPRKVGAPIYDLYVGLWISKYAKKDFKNVTLNSQIWNTRTYSLYLEWVKKHAIHLDCYSDEVELAIFNDAILRLS